MDAKTKAIIAHIPYIGWVIALVINMNQKEEYASYYIRQTLGIYLAGFLIGFFKIIPFIGYLFVLAGGMVVFIFWLMSLIWSITDVMKPVPVLGDKFQEWFKSL
jgi:hypothetical protein